MLSALAPDTPWLPDGGGDELTPSHGGDHPVIEPPAPITASTAILTRHLAERAACL